MSQLGTGKANLKQPVFHYYKLYEVNNVLLVHNIMSASALLSGFAVPSWGSPCRRCVYRALVCTSGRGCSSTCPVQIHDHIPRCPRSPSTGSSFAPQARSYTQTNPQSIHDVEASAQANEPLRSICKPRGPSPHMPLQSRLPWSRRRSSSVQGP